MLLLYLFLKVNLGENWLWEVVLLVQLLQAIQVAEKAEKPPISDLFTDVYESLPSNLCEQEELLRESIKRHPQDYPTNVPV